MKLLVRYVFLIAVLSSACCDEAKDDASFLDNVLPESAYSSHANESGAYNLTLSALKGIALSANQTKQREIYVIGEVALSQAESHLAKIGEAGQRPEKAEIGKSARLYSDMISAFKMLNLPIKLYPYELQIPQLPGDMRSGVNRNLNPPEEDYMQQSPHIPPEIETPEGLSEDSRGGVTAIWAP